MRLRNELRAARDVKRVGPDVRARGKQQRPRLRQLVNREDVEEQKRISLFNIIIFRHLLLLGLKSLKTSEAFEYGQK